MREERNVHDVTRLGYLLVKKMQAETYRLVGI